MTTLHEQSAEVEEAHADDLLQELTQLRGMHSELREELAAVRRQRDEAISQSQWLITRVTNAERAIERLQDELLGERAKHSSVLRLVEDVDAEPVEAEEAEPEPATLDLPDAVEGEPTGWNLDDEPADVVVPSAALDDETVDDDVVPEVVALELPRQVPAPGSWAGQVGAWLPPEEPPTEASMAHEFAALTERALAVEAAAAEESAAEMPTTPVSMDVLPGAGGSAKRTSLFRRR